jgi:NAD(P)-dependent dehydrogenase (short-subunit alcohol dehydrogenase family)
VAGFIRALAVELRDTGITANAVSPGSTATPILDESARLYGLPSRRRSRRPNGAGEGSTPPSRSPG